MKAMILAAGRGRRMSPLTDDTAKPLIELAGKPLIVHRIEALAEAGFKEIVINVSYKADQIMEYLGDGSRYGVEIQYSYEPEVGGLETGGGIFQALPLLGDQPFIVVSSDVYTDYDFKQLTTELTGLAHLVLVPNPPYHPTGDFGLADDGKLVDPEPCYNYAGFGVLDPKLFAGRKPGKFQMVELIRKAMADGQVSGELYTGVWFNIGTPDLLQTAEKALVPVNI